MTLTAYRVLLLVVGGASSIAFARLLGPAEFGVYASAAAALSIVLILNNLGIDQLYLRRELELAELRERSTQLAVITVAMAGAGALLWPGLTYQARLCMALLGVAAAVDDLKLPYLLEPQYRLDFARRGRRELLLQTIVVGVSLVAAIAFRDAFALAGGLLAASLLGIVPVAATLGSPTRRPRPGSRQTFRRALPYSVAGAVYTAYFQIDAALLASLRPAADVGIYRAAYAFVFALIVFPVAMNGDIMLGRYYALDRKSPEARRVLQRFALASLAAGAMAMAAVELAGPPGVWLLLGPRYRGATTLVQILGLALLPHFFNSWAGNSLVGRGHVHLVMSLQASLVAINVIGNLIFIPMSGVRAAAWMTVVTESAGAVLYLTALWRLRGPRW